MKIVTVEAPLSATIEHGTRPIQVGGTRGWVPASRSLALSVPKDTTQVYCLGADVGQVPTLQMEGEIVHMPLRLGDLASANPDTDLYFAIREILTRFEMQGVKAGFSGEPLFQLIRVYGTAYFTLAITDCDKPLFVK